MFKFALWLTTGQCTKGVGGVHRKHHAFTDEEGDPHSRKSKASGTCSSATCSTTFARSRRPMSSHATPATSRTLWWDTHLFNRGLLGLFVGTSALCLIVGSLIGVWWALLAAGIHAVMYVFVLSSSINGLCHHVGYKNFPNTATNIRTLALLTGGEGLHNNHHGYPRSPKFSFRASEIDPAWPLIKLLILLKLAKPYKTIEEIAA